MPVIEPEIPEATQDILDFYTERYQEVWAVYCLRHGRKKGKQMIAVEVRGEVGGLRVNEIGVTTIPIDNHLASSRVRIDSKDGERVMGYECGWYENPNFNPKEEESDENPRNLKCHNNSILGKVEEAHAPDRCKQSRVFEILPHEMPGFVEAVDKSTKKHPQDEPFARERIK